MSDLRWITKTIAEDFLATLLRTLYPGKMTLMTLGFSLALILSTCQAEAARVHLIAVGDTKDKTIGEIVRSDINNLTDAFASLGKKSLMPPVVLIDDACRPDTIIQQLNKIPVLSEDAVVLYFSGHGAYDKNNGQFLQIPRLNNAGNMPRSRLRDTLKGWVDTKRIHLGVFMTDMCNLRKVIEIPQTAAPSKVAPAAEAVIEDKPLFQSLFLDSEGFVDVSSASPDEAALTYPLFRFADNKETVTYLHVGSLYAGAFIGMMRSNEKMRFSWETFLRSKVAPELKQEFRRTYPNGIDLPDGVNMQFTQTLMINSVAKLKRGSEDKDEEVIADGLNGMGDNQFSNIKKPELGRIQLGVGPDLAIYTVQTPQGPRNGVRIGSIIQDSPAAGRLDIGDIILSINDRPTPTPKQLNEAIAKAGDDLKIIGRNIRNGTIQVFPPIPLVQKRSSNWLGVGPDLSIYRVQTPEGACNGVRIGSIRSNSPAYGRLDPGDIILSVNGTPTPTAEKFRAALTDLDVELRIVGWNIRNGKVEEFPPIPNPLKRKN
jgi:hypothetical protein